jgi:MIP family channel proteins
MVYSLSQKLFAEFAGTLTLVLIGAGSICADQYLRANGQTNVGVLAIAIANGLTMALMVSAIGHISGGHLNPAITIGLWVTRRLGTMQTLFYWIAQVLGALAAAFLLITIVPESIWRPVALGTPDLAPITDFTRMHAMILEAVLTFILVFVFFATIVDLRGVSNRLAGFAVGLTVTIGTLFGYPFTGAAMNPARAFGPALAARHWSNHGVYWVGPLFGGVLAGVIYDRFFLRDQPPS